MKKGRQYVSPFFVWLNDMQRLLQQFFFIVSLLSAHSLTYAFDSANDSTVDKADRFEFEDFHKDSAVTLWGKDKDKKEETKAITTYKETTSEEPKAQKPEGTLETEAVPAKNNPAFVSATEAAKTQTNNTQKYDKGQELKVRSAYKLSVDPSLNAIPTLFEAVQNLHQQLNGYCPDGWKKEEEWHKPEANYFYIHYRAICL